MFSKQIISWYQQNKRNLPWRQIQDPYSVWLSEIILQQTRVSQGIPYYNRFIKTYPKLQNLAEASEREILVLWQGLGYYSRARNMHYTARYIIDKLNGHFPQSYKELNKLKGVGDYTAAAIASFCYNEEVAVVDGNVYRVLARYFCVKTPVNTTQAKKEFKALAMKLIDSDNPGLFNQAIMEFGSLQCTPKNPDCYKCPLNKSCFALQNKQVDSLPQKNKKLKIKKRFFNYIVFKTSTDKTYIEQRKGKGIWENLYEFPLVETKKEIAGKELFQNKDFINIIGEQEHTITECIPDTIIHKLSHQHLYIKFWIVYSDLFDKKLIAWDELKNYPFPIVLYNFIHKKKAK